MTRAGASPLAAYFEARVDKSGGPSACWPWRKPGRFRPAALAWQAAFGPVPEGRAVRPCPRRLCCCNAAHLSLAPARRKR